MFSNSLDRCYNIAKLRERAQKNMPAAMFHYIDGAAGDEWTMRQNTDAFDNYELVPRFLVDVSEIDMRTKVFGREISMPFICAPTAMSRLATSGSGVRRKDAVSARPSCSTRWTRKASS